MKIPHNIRNLYLPVQPTVRQSADHVQYQEFLPHLQLQPFIYCYWQLKTTQTLQESFQSNQVLRVSFCCQSCAREKDFMDYMHFVQLYGKNKR